VYFRVQEHHAGSRLKYTHHARSTGRHSVPCHRVSSISAAARRSVLNHPSYCHWTFAICPMRTQSDSHAGVTSHRQLRPLYVHPPCPTTCRGPSCAATSDDRSSQSARPPTTGARRGVRLVAVTCTHAWLLPHGFSAPDHFAAPVTPTPVCTCCICPPLPSASYMHCLLRHTSRSR